MNKLEEICKKFVSLKTQLKKSDIDELCYLPFKSILKGLKNLSSDYSSSKNLDEYGKNNPINTDYIKSNNKNKEFYKNLLITLDSSKKEKKNLTSEKNINEQRESDYKERSHSPSINNEANDSPHIIKENENIDLMEKDIINEIRGKTIPLNEEEENNETSSYKNKLKKNSNQKNSNKNISFYIIDKTDKNVNIRDKIIEYLNNYDDKLTLISKSIPQIKLVDDYYYKSKESLLMKYILEIKIISIDTIKKLIYLCFNVLSKVFSALIKENESKINSSSNDIIDIIKLLLDFIKVIKTFIINNGDNIDVSFLKEMKNIGKYCLYVIIIKKYNCQYMNEIENKNENEKKIEFFNDYKKYFKIVNKIKNNFKDNNLFMKHFIVQPSMISFIDLLEINRKIINFQLNVNYKI